MPINLMIIMIIIIIIIIIIISTIIKHLYTASGADY